MIIFGFGSRRPKDRGGVVPMSCPNCNNESIFRHISQTKWFSLFFIPLIPYSTKHFLLCPVCSQGRQLTSTQVARTTEMIGITSAYQQQSISAEHYVEHARGYGNFLNAIDVPQPSPPAAAPPPPQSALPAPAPALPASRSCAHCQCPMPAAAAFCPDCGTATA